MREHTLTADISAGPCLSGASGCENGFRLLSLVTGLVFCCLLSVVLLTFVKWSVFEDQQSVLFT